MAKKDIGDILLDKGIITQAQLEEVRRAQKSTSSDAGKILIDLGYADEKQVTEARAQALGMQFVDLTSYQVDSSAINVVPDHIARRHSVIPIAKSGNRLTVAFADPNNVFASDDLRLATGCSIQPVLAAPSAIEEAIQRHYTRIEGSDGGAAAAAMAPTSGPVSMASISEAIAAYGARADVVDDEAAMTQMAEEAPIVRMAHTIIQMAIRDAASDIHVEPQIRNVRIRYRVDGVLHEVMTLPKYIQAPLISRYKIMSEMNIAERRVPQDGRIPVRFEGKDYDLRVSCIPTNHGEKIVMRILDKTSIMIGLNKLGFFPEVQAQLEDLVAQPNGMVLSTGPTGHGKTTTQYSVLHKINSIEKNIITVEDPIEYELAGVSQVQVNPKAGLRFSNALRSFLRQDPDIIMVGEMRDLETAEVAIEAALTGHLVLSTLHTNDAPSAVIRMVDMGVEPYLIAATVIGVLAQRLARKICANCKEAYEVDGSELRRFGFKGSLDQKVVLHRGRGCDMCRHTGYKGRLGIFELMRVNDEIRELIVRRAPLADIREAAKANGMNELREDGLRKVLEGITTPDEVMRVVFTAGVD